MNLSRIYAISLRYWYLLYNYPQRFMSIFVWGTFDIILWGFVTMYLGSLGIGALNFTSLLLGTLVFWQLITRVQQAFITVHLEDVWSRNFFNIFASPMSVTEYVVGIMLASFSTSTVAFAFGAFLALAFFGLELPTFGIPIVLLFIALVLFGLALGIISAAIVLRLGPSAEWFAWPIPAIIQPFVGVFYPIAVLPVWMQWVAYALPPSYVFEGLRVIFTGSTPALHTLLSAIGIALIYVIITGAVFVRTYQWARRSGALARYSAESTA